MGAYKELYDKAQEIVDEMNYKGYWRIETEGYGAVLVLPWCEIDLT